MHPIATNSSNTKPVKNIYHRKHVGRFFAALKENEKQFIGFSKILFLYVRY